METVIARTKKSIMGAYIFVLVLGAILVVFGLASLLFASDKFMCEWFVSLGSVFLVLGIVFTVYFARLPKVCITFKEGKMRLHNGLEFSPAEIDYCTGSTLWFDWGLYNYGTIIISVKHQEYKYRFVVAVNSVVANINVLKTQFTALEEVQKHIAEKNAAENAAETAQNDENQG